MKPIKSGFESGMLWETLLVGLDDDERVVFPQMYRDNLDLYDRFRGIAYLVRSNTDPDAGLDWVWAGSLETIQKRLDLTVLSKVYIVGLRLPWNEVEGEWLCTQDELDSHRTEYRVLDVYLKVRKKGDPTIIPLIDPLEFEENRDEYEVIEALYRVCWCFLPSEVKERFVEIPGDRFHTFLSK